MCIKTKQDVPGPVLRHADFSTGLYAASQQISGNQQDMVMSPVSILMLLNVLLGSTGPQGNTANEICQAINGNDDPCTPDMMSQIRKNYEKMMGKLTKTLSKAPHKRPIVRIANAAFIRKNFDIKLSFRNAFLDGNRNQVESIDFEEPLASSTINNWVNSSTDGLIRRIYASSDALPKETVMVLLNTIYFIDAWKHPFSPFTTRKGNFRLAIPNGGKREVEMMHIEEAMRYYKRPNDGFHMVLKKFENERFQFAVILPLEGKNISALDKVFKKGFPWAAIDQNAEKHVINLKLPKFKLESEMDLKAVLSALGIRELFDYRTANLSGISTTHRLYVNDVKQNAVIEVNEAGVKAAAATSMQVGLTSVQLPTVDFTVDQPFFCAIYDTKLKIPLFLARVFDPKLA